MFLRGFDVCLMPFAINRSTRYISPTKTLEYLAARKPIVSTPVPDVVATWADVVRIATDAKGFARVVESALAEGPEERGEREARQDNAVARNRWKHIADEMRGLIDTRLAENMRCKPDG